MQPAWSCIAKNQKCSQITWGETSAQDQTLTRNKKDLIKRWGERVGRQFQRPEHMETPTSQHITEQTWGEIEQRITHGQGQALQNNKTPTEIETIRQ